MPSATSSLNKKIVKAGAGAGKTTDLVSLFLKETEDFYFKHRQWPKIVVTTFTRKATQELKERIQHKVLEVQADLRNQVEQPQENPDPSLVEKIEFYQSAFDYVNKKSYVQISTIHGVLNLFLRAVALNINLSADFTFVSREETFTSAQKILKNTFLQDEAFVDLLEDYDFNTLTQIFINLFQNWMILGSVKGVSSAELLEISKLSLLENINQGEPLIQAILTETDHEGWVTYLQSIANALRQLRPQVEQESDFILEPLSEALAAKKPMFSTKKMPFSQHLDEEFVDWRTRIKEALDDLITLSEIYQSHDQIISSLNGFTEPFCQQFLNLKLQSGMISMADLELLSIYAIRTQPEVGESFASAWNLWMIDEFQDTSPVQESILESLIGHTKSYYVGDPQQSIYLFRGARSEVFFNKAQKIEEGGGKFTQKLINYRSYPSVLNLVNEVFPRIHPQMFTKMELGKTDAEKKAQHPLFWNLPEESPQELAVAERAQELLEAGFAAESIAILLRTNSQIKKIAEVFDLLRLPYQVHGGGGFFSRREIQDLLLIIKFILNPKDDLNFFSLLRSPWMPCTDQEIIEIRKLAKSQFWLAVGKQDLHSLQRLKQMLSDAENFGTLFALKDFIKGSDFLNCTELYDSTGRREANIWKFISLVENESRRPGFSWLQFVLDSKLAASGELENEDGDATPVISPNRVNLMTIHSSKGLQFQQVLIPFLEKKSQLSNAKIFMIDEQSGHFTVKVPHPETSESIESVFSQKLKKELNQREKDESLRVFYVACTRAVTGLTFFMQGVAEKGSWGSLLPLEAAEGTYTLGECTYQVRQELPKPAEAHSISKAAGTVRPLFLEDELEQNRFSVTQAEAYQIFPSVEGIYKSVLGTEFHEIMESLKYLSFDQIAPDLTDEQLKGVENILADQSFPLREILESGFTEFGFSFLEGQRKFTGQIDLWGQHNQCVWIVDYKTGSQKYEEKAFQQLSFYHYGLLKIMEVHKDQEVKLAVVYPFERKIAVRSSSSEDCQKVFKALTTQADEKSL